MKLFYITLNTDQEARTISRELLENKIAICTNWFAINCAYRCDNSIKEEPEVALIVKTTENQHASLEAVITKHIDYTNFIGEIDVASVNEPFSDWLNTLKES